jgi:hypothetical protein
LVGWVSGELDSDVRMALEEASEHAGTRVISGPVHSLSPRAGMSRRWLRSWSLVDATGVLQRVSLAVDEDAIGEVAVLVGSRFLGRQSAPWIAQDSADAVNPEADAEARRIFCEALMLAVQVGIDRAWLRVAS